MTRTVRAKFYVSHVEKNEDASEEVIAYPVTDGSEENTQFWEATPGGELRLWISNPDACGYFIEGQEYYLDFTPA